MKNMAQAACGLIVILRCGLALADLPDAPMGPDILVVIPSAYDTSIIPDTLVSEWAAFTNFATLANGSGEYEPTYNAIPYIDRVGGYRDARYNLPQLVYLLSSITTDSTISWGEHQFLLSDDYLTVESWESADVISCENEARERRGEYRENGIDGLPLIFGGYSEEYVIRPQPWPLPSGRISCSLLLYKDWIGQVLRANRPHIKARWFHSVRCFSTSRENAQNFGIAFNASVVSGYDDAVLPDQARDSTSEVLAYLGGNYRGLVLPGVGISNPSADSNYAVDQAVGLIESRTGSTNYGIKAWVPDGCTDKVRLYSTPRVNELLLRRDGTDGYRFFYSEGYPWIEPAEGELDYPGLSRLDRSRIGTIEPRDELTVSVQLTSRIERNEELRAELVNYNAIDPRVIPIRLVRMPGASGMEQWESAMPVELSGDMEDGLWTLRLQGRGSPRDNNECLDSDGDGKGTYDEENSEEPCSDTNHKFLVRKVGIKEFKQNHDGGKSSGKGGSGQQVGLGEAVDFMIQFTDEMDPSAIPIMGIIGGISQTLVLDLANAHWQSGLDNEGKPLPGSVFVGTWSIPSDLQVGGQDFLALHFDVSGVFTKSGRQLKTFTEDIGKEPLVGMFDLVRPIAGFADVRYPIVECGALEVLAAFLDLPAEREPGVPIPREGAFGRMTFIVEQQNGGEWVPFTSQSLSSPDQLVFASGFQAGRNYRWYFEIEDAAGNLDEVSFREQGGPRQTAQEFFVAGCQQTLQDSLSCIRVQCNAAARRCERTSTCPPPGWVAEPCLSLYCEEGSCESIETCYPPYSGDWSDDNVDLADLVPTMDTVTNLRADAEIAMMEGGVAAAMFGLLAEFGEEARLVSARLAPAELEGVSLLILPSGSL